MDEANQIVSAAERIRRRSGASLKILLPTAAALGAGAALAVAQIPGSDGTITGCYQTVTQGQSGADFPYGTLRLIDPSGNTSASVDPSVYSCASTEQTITWNQQGPNGPEGPTGPSGPVGGKGAQGLPGQVYNSSTIGYTSGSDDTIYVKLGGISGEVTQKAVNGDIEALSWSAGSEAPMEGVSVNLGKVTVQSFTFMKKADATDGALFNDVATHKVIGKAEVGIYHRSKGGKLSEVADYDLTNVKITSIQNKGSTETINATFAHMKGTVGTGADKVTTSWDIATNSKG